MRKSIDLNDQYNMGRKDHMAKNGKNEIEIFLRYSCDYKQLGSRKYEKYIGYN